METAFGWLGEFVRWLAAFVPHLSIVRPHEVLLKFVRGRHVRVRPPGLRVWWPVVTEAMKIFCGRQILTLAPQTLISRCGRTIVCTAIVVYKIEDVEKYAVDNWDPDEAVAEVASAGLRKALVSMSVEEVQHARADVDKTLAREVQKPLEDLGVRVVQVRLASYATARVLNFVGAQQVLQADRGQAVQPS